MARPKNNLLLRALKRKKVTRPPVWMMRQAGRYLPDFMKLRKKYSFFDRVQNPALVAEITVMPVDQVGVDAAILFSDILVIPQAMGVEVQMIPGVGPKIPDPIQTMKQVKRLRFDSPSESLNYVFRGIKETLSALDNRVPLIGFAGAPWTVFCYMVEGGGSRGFHRAKEFCYTNPDAAALLLEKITTITIDYLEEKIDSGVHALQLFDSWGGILSHEDYHQWSLPYIKRIVSMVRRRAPIIVFAKGTGLMLEELAGIGAQGLGIDWTITPTKARNLAGNKVTLQGNFDPAKLLSPIPVIRAEAKKMAKEFGKTAYIANLGHGILPEIPVDHAKAFVDALKDESLWA